MKFINYLSSISGIGIYPLVTLLIFVPFFTMILIWVVSSDKKRMDTLAHIPIEDNDASHI